ncbi:hypothetical protein HDV63DRAFT_389888 [Trichoderma sp. SZMC 28014]
MFIFVSVLASGSWAWKRMVLPLEHPRRVRRVRHWVLKKRYRYMISPWLLYGVAKFLSAIAALIVQYRMRVRCISDWLDETPRLGHTILYGERCEETHSVSHSASITRPCTCASLPPGPEMKPQAKPKRPLAGSRAAPLWPGPFLRQSSLQPTVFFSPADAQYNACLFGMVIQRLPAKAVFCCFRHSVAD